MKRIKRLIKISLVLIFIVASVFSYFKIQPMIYPIEYSEYVEEYCKEYSVDSNLAYAIIKCESSFNPKAVSSVGAIGLMQLTPDTFDWVQTKLPSDTKYTKDDLYEPKINIKYGIFLISLHLKEFGDIDTALAAYHAGRGNANKWLEMEESSENGKTLNTTPYKETNAYIERVGNVMEKYNYMRSNEFFSQFYGYNQSTE